MEKHSRWTSPGVGPPVLADGVSFSLPDKSLPMDLSFQLGVYPSKPRHVSIYRHKLCALSDRVSPRDPRLFRRPMSDRAPLLSEFGEMPKPEHVQVFSVSMKQVAAAPLPSSDEEEEVVSPRAIDAFSSEQVVPASRQTEVDLTDSQNKTEVNPATVALPLSDSGSSSDSSSDSDWDDASSSSSSTCNSSPCAKCNGSDSSSDSGSDSSSNSSSSSSNSSSSSSSEDEDSSSEEDDVSDHPTPEVDHSCILDHKSGPSAETSPCSSGSPTTSAYGSSSGSSSGSAASSGCSSGSSSSSGYGSAAHGSSSSCLEQTPGTSSAVTFDPDLEKRLTITRYGPQARGLRVWYNEDEVNIPSV
ncbi:uncharacterized protein DDB_G0271670-like [Haliotis rufescens]|uniref:uncharacterized protein DDB_G0271670-like n=1 Tax=Haliotis rufescens TaxID=6454 RepID=UPI00201F19C1|nr:uncharacterized protein DDB_G0271670-like [Haliotis rufescens]